MDNTIRWMLIAGSVAAGIAAVAWAADNRRARRKNLDSVGFMPWTSIFFFALLAAVILLGVGGRAALT